MVVVVMTAIFVTGTSEMAVGAGGLMVVRRSVGDWRVLAVVVGVIAAVIWRVGRGGKNVAAAGRARGKVVAAVAEADTLSVAWVGMARRLTLRVDRDAAMSTAVASAAAARRRAEAGSGLALSTTAALEKIAIVGREKNATAVKPAGGAARLTPSRGDERRRIPPALGPTMAAAAPAGSGDGGEILGAWRRVRGAGAGAGVVDAALGTGSADRERSTGRAHRRRRGGTCGRKRMPVGRVATDRMTLPRKIAKRRGR